MRLLLRKMVALYWLRLDYMSDWIENMLTEFVDEGEEHQNLAI